MSEKPLSLNEAIKEKSNFLRNGIEESLADPITGATHPEAEQILKFHGIYLQDDRDIRAERAKQKLEPLYSMMIRVRLPGGICTPKQWLVMDELARTYGNGTLRLTTRQTFQLHGILKRNLKATVAGINHALMDSIAACGDVNRNVMCSVNPHLSKVHEEAYQWAVRIAEHLLPKSRAYYEIWLDEKKIAGEEEEPVYGKTYLPRKFKIAVANPPKNDVDVFANDIGLITIVEDGALRGFNLAVGGGLSKTHGDDSTYSRLGTVIGYCDKDRIVDVCEKILTVQRDYGDRSNRKHARLRYTIDDRGVDWFKEELEKRLGHHLKKEMPYVFTTRSDQYGWVKGDDDLWHFTLFVENGRVKDTETVRIMSGLRSLAAMHEGDFRITPNQNLIIARVPEGEKANIEKVLKEHGVPLEPGIYAQAMACVAFPTCPQAMAESERYLPSLMAKIGAFLKVKSIQDTIIVRMSGCPNACSRAYLGEIGLVGKAPGLYDLYLGGNANGTRLAQKCRDSLREEEILQELNSWFERFAKERHQETFGDFTWGAMLEGLQASDSE
jgi:sulfite reductase (NADPH) hemoprotein beta-component